jgi:eukaryotic-like serine/threonine-protein kinase
MPAPATVAELLDLVQKSGVADDNRLKPYLEKLKQQGGIPPEPSKVAGLLVRDGMLTYFQAAQLLEGKYKRFTLGKYKVLEKLGSGGMGTVFLCEHKLMRRLVAVKVLPTAKAADEASLGRFYREARAVAAVDHPNLVRAYDIDQDENLHFLVMEYVDGTNLQDLVKKFGPLDVVRACHYIYGAAVGLQHANEIGLIHRDIKPGNILLDRTGVVKILDMGLARLLHDTEDNLTRQYDENILGTADYLSPEQAEDSHAVDIRTDIYSLGATFYFLLTGFPPFPEGTIPQKLIWVRGREPKAIRAIRPEVPEEVVAVVSKMMAKKPEDRYQLPAEIMAALTPWASMPIAPPPVREMPQLSPAVSGGNTGGMRPGASSSPRSMMSPVPALNGLAHSGMATAIGSSITPSPSRISAETQTDGVWESLADLSAGAGTDVATASDGSRTPLPQPKSAKYRAMVAGKKKSLPILAICVAGLLFVTAAIGTYFAFFNKKSTVEPTALGDRVKRIVVSRPQAQAGAENAVATLREAIQKAGLGDTISIAESPLTEPFLRLRSLKDLTIESGLPGGKPVSVLFESPGGNGSSLPVFELSGCDNIRIKDLDIDGRGVAEFGIVVSGNAPGVTLENVTVRNVKSTPFRLANVAGLPGRSTTLDRVRALVSQSNDAAVRVEATGTLVTKFVAIRNSRFEGPGKIGLKFDGALNDVEATGNRFYKLEAAIVLSRIAEGRPYRAQLNENTIYESKFGLQFVGMGSGPMHLTVNRNYFAKTQAIVEGPGVVGVGAAENGQRESGPGNGPIAAQPIDSPQLPPPNPDDDATFLRFPASSGPMIGASRIGAK